MTTTTIPRADCPGCTCLPMSWHRIVKIGSYQGLPYFRCSCGIVVDVIMTDDDTDDYAF